MERLTLAADLRQATGTGPARRLRDTGLVPAVLYGTGVPPTALQIDEHALAPLMGKNVLIDLKIGNVTKTVIIKDIQRDAIRRSVKHVDLQAVSMNEKIHLSIPIHLEGAPEGAKAGGVLQHILHLVDIECLPGDLPEAIRLDVSRLQVGETLTVGDIPAMPNVTVLTPATEPLATVVVPRMGEIEATGEEGIVTKPEITGQKHSADAEEAPLKEAAKAY